MTLAESNLKNEDDRQLHIASLPVQEIFKKLIQHHPCDTSKWLAFEKGVNHLLPEGQTD